MVRSLGPAPAAPGPDLVLAAIALRSWDAISRHGGGALARFGRRRDLSCLGVGSSMLPLGIQYSEEPSAL